MLTSDVKDIRPFTASTLSLIRLSVNIWAAGPWFVPKTKDHTILSQGIYTRLSHNSNRSKRSWIIIKVITCISRLMKVSSWIKCSKTTTSISVKNNIMKFFSRRVEHISLSQTTLDSKSKKIMGFFIFRWQHGVAIMQVTKQNFIHSYIYIYIYISHTYYHG